MQAPVQTLGAQSSHTLGFRHERRPNSLKPRPRPLQPRHGPAGRVSLAIAAVLPHSGDSGEWQRLCPHFVTTQPSRAGRRDDRSAPGDVEKDGCCPGLCSSGLLGLVPPLRPPGQGGWDISWAPGPRQALGWIAPALPCGRPGSAGGQSLPVPRRHTSGLSRQETLGSEGGVAESHRSPVTRRRPGPQSTASSPGVRGPHPASGGELTTRQAAPLRPGHPRL